jgi:copper ion binding protein
MSTTQSTTLTAPDISCGHCVATVNEAVGTLDGIERVEANEQTKQVIVEFDPQCVSEPQIRAALDEAGYPAQP